MSVLTHAALPAGAKLPENTSGRLFVLKTTIDAAVTNVGSADVVKAFTPPANTKVLEVLANVKTAEGGTLTFDVGDYEVADDSAEDADGFIDGANGNAVAAYSSRTETLTLGEGTPNTVSFSPAYRAGKVYDGTDYIGVLINNDANAAVIVLTALCVDVG